MSASPSMPRTMCGGLPLPPRQVEQPVVTPPPSSPRVRLVAGIAGAGVAIAAIRRVVAERGIS